jgi:cobalt-zinc-cadmium efflux system membrane fusion protein
MLANAPNLFAPLFVISDPTRLWVQLDAADSDLPSLRPGEKIRIHSNAFPGQVFDGVINNVGEELDPTTRTMKVRGVVDNPEKRLKAEMYVMADVVEDVSKVESAGVDVPAKAVFMIANQYYLFVEQSPGRVQRREVKIGTEKDGLIPVLSGVAAGDRVAAEGALLLQSLVDPAD